MKIEPTNSLDPKSVTERHLPVSGHAPVAHAAASGAAAIGPEAGLVIERQHESYIRQAAAAEDFNAQAVADAIKALDAGELDSLHAIDRLAEKLADLGL